MEKKKLHVKTFQIVELSRLHNRLARHSHRSIRRNCSTHSHIHTHVVIIELINQFFNILCIFHGVCVCDNTYDSSGGGRLS